MSIETGTARSRVAFAVAHLDRFLGEHGRLLFQGAGMKLFDIREAGTNPQ